MTDGYIGNEREILAEETARLGQARVFGFGVGTSVNHYLLSRMSQVGRGFYQYVRPDEDPAPAVERFVQRLSRPMLTDVQLAFSGTEVFDVLPKKVPDLFDAQPLVVLGRYRNPGLVHLTVTGHRGAEPVELKVDAEIPPQAVAGSGLRQLWARAKIEQLDAEQYFGERTDAIAQITTLGLEHHLVTAYTSLIAVDDRQVTKGGQPKQVAVPTEKPDQTRNGESTVVSRVPVTGEGEETDRDGDSVPDSNDAWDGKDSPPPAPPGHLTLDGRMNGTRTTVNDPTLKSEPVGGRPNPYTYKSNSHEDDDFSSAFGGDDKPAPPTTLPAPEPEPRTKHRSNVYIPPPAGGRGDNVKDTLGQADIMEVVLGHKRELAQCAVEAHKREPGVTGKLVMRWVVLISGRTSRVEVVSEEFKNTYMATCVRRLIQSWLFPRSKVQGDPVIFPFKF